MKLIRPWKALCTTIALTALATSTDRPYAQSTPAPYTLTDLGTLGGGSTQANDLNDAAQVVGYSSATSGTHAFRWQDGLMTDLGTLPDGWGSYAVSVNGLGDAVGTANLKNGLGRAVLWRNGTIVNLTPELPVYEDVSHAVAINDSGQIVLSINDTPFVLDTGTRTAIGTLGGPGAFAADLNNAGQVVGTSTQRAFLWDNGTMTDLGLLPGDQDSGASAINDLGVIVGSSGWTDPDTYEQHYRPFIYANGTMSAIPAPSSEAFAGDINDAGVVVGTMRAGGAVTPWHAWIYVNGVVTNLNSLVAPGSGLHLRQAHAINNQGQIAGVAMDAQGRYHGFLLTPAEGAPPAPAAPSIGINDVERSEGRNGTTTFAFTVQLSVSTTATVRVNFATADGAALAGSDYTAAAGALVFNPGETTKTVNVEVRGDRLREPDESFFVNLSSADGGTVFDGQGTGTIRNDDR
jgi:probable HAF family extracellular repeat protein